MPIVCSLSSAPPAPAAEVSHNLVGQKLGRKGQETRERILAAMLRLMDDFDGPPATLTSIAREASVRLPNLYLYFPDMGELLLAALRRVTKAAAPDFSEFMHVRWPDVGLRETCHAFLRAHFAFWNRNARIMHMRNAVADSGDMRLLAYRNDTSRPLLDMLVFQMDASDDARASAMATVLLTGFERMATVMTSPNLRHAGMIGEGFDRDMHVASLLDAESELLSHAIASQRARIAALNG